MIPIRKPFAPLLALLLCLLFAGLPATEAGAVKKKPAAPGRKAGPPKKPSKPKGRKKGPSHAAPKARKGPRKGGKAVRKPVPLVLPVKPLDPSALVPVDFEMVPGTLDPFFRDLAALEAGATDNGAPRVVRVLHFGDSHVAADYWTGEFRRLMQARFGDGGVGTVMPGRPWRYFRNALAKTLDGDGWHTVGLKTAPADGVLGLSGTALFPGGTSPASVLAPGARFSVTLASEADNVAVRILVDGEPFDNLSVRSRWINSGGSDISFLALGNRDPLPDVPRKVSVVALPDRGTRLLGAEFFSGRSGVVVDTLGLNGARMTALDKWSPRMRQHLLQEAKPSLIVVSYGTNEIAAPHFTFEGFKADCVRSLKALREDAGGVPVLVTGPFDRAERRKRRMVPLTEAEKPVVRALREAAAETGCAFWDAQRAMGGEGSILPWIKAGLAQHDGVHLTQPGYELQGRLLFERLMAARAAAGAPVPAGDNAAR